MQPVRIGVIVDWDRSPRGEAWTAFLAGLNGNGQFRNEARLYRIANLVVGQPKVGEVGSTVSLRDEEVLIINWDAINGDPEYGAHRAFRWFEHRGPEILSWVLNGGVLIIEGQAVLGVPFQPAYDALAGPRELRVCGHESRDNPLLQGERCGTACRRTRHMPKVQGFDLVPKLLRVAANPTYETYFPPLTDRIMAGGLRSQAWSTMLYRGWFRRFGHRRAALPWMPLLETADRRWLHNQPTLLAARLNDGAVFASTMFLATTDQIALVHAMLKCARGNNKHLPAPNSVLARVRRYWLALLGLVVGLAGTTLTDITERTLLPGLVARAQALGLPVGMPSDDHVKAALGVAIPVVGAVLLDAALKLYATCRTWIRDVLGY